MLTEKDTLKVSTGQSRAEPHYETHAGRLANLISELLRIQNGARLAADIAAGLRAGQAFATAYTRAKRAAGVADFNDLIDWTRDLLKQPGIGDWVRYKLDREVDHVLVDEAQDTNAAQWDIIGELVAEYFSGSSESEERHRTLFMVGDLKQAIYGFQGTDPKRFEQAREEFRQRADELRDSEDTLDLFKRRTRDFRDLSIAASFRSAQPVLDVVDAVIDELGPEALALGARRRGTLLSTTTGRGRSSCGSRSRRSSMRRAMKARSAGFRSAPGNMPTRLPRGSARSSRRRRSCPRRSGR